jgi:hypothetical protein
MKYQVAMLGQAIDSENYPFEALVLSKDWGNHEIEETHNIFEKWSKVLEQGGAFNATDFETEFQEKLGQNYQGLKSIILAFWKNYQWMNVCEAYVDSFGTSPSIEYHAIQNRKR